MDVTRVTGNGTQTVAAPPPPPPAPAPRAPAPSPAPAPTPVPAQAPAAPALTEGQQVDRPAERNDPGDMLRRVVREVNSSIENYGRHLGIRVHEATGRRVVTVYDSSTNEAVREIPPERVLDAHAHLLELAGLFVDARG